jgi:predicted dehydrogenase
MAGRKRYVLVGAGSRAQLYYEGIAGPHREAAELAALCDVNNTRMQYAISVLRDRYRHPAVPTYRFDDFDVMLKKEKPDAIIVASIDRTHHHYIVRGLQAGCELITEKPMAIDAEKCQQILDAVKATRGRVRVCFNYRYAPHNSKLKELLMSGIIGEVYSVHFEWLLDTRHGADYFRRWHRDKRNSGGLLVHKATHHFDLVNFWLDSIPKTVFCMADLRFYGRENAERRGVASFYSRAFGNEIAAGDRFALHLDQDAELTRMYLEAEHEDGYFRDQSVFGDGISIEDTMGVLVRYRNKAILTYSLNAYTPWEGFRIALNGSAGRIQLEVREEGYVSGRGEGTEVGVVEHASILVSPLFGEPQLVEIAPAEGGHGGADPLLLRDLFGPAQEDPLRRQADHLAGAYSILVGIAANRSMASGQAIEVDELVRL